MDRPTPAVAAAETVRQLVDERRHRIGAADVPAILGLLPNRTKLTVWERLTGRAKDDDDDDMLLRLGRMIEPLTAEVYAEETGRKVRRHDHPTGLVVHPGYDFLCCHLDFLFFDEKRGDGVLECKWSPVKAYEWEDEAPVAAQIQLMTQMGIVKAAGLGGDHGSIAGILRWPPREFKYQDFTYHADFVERLFQMLVTFWERYVETDTPPEPKGVEADKKALARIYPPAEELATKRVALPDESIEWAEKWEEAQETARVAKITVLEYQNRFKAAVGNAPFGDLPDGRVFSWKSQTKREHVMPETTYKVPRLHKAKVYRRGRK